MPVGRAHLQRRLRVQPVFLQNHHRIGLRRFGSVFLQHGVVFLLPFAQIFRQDGIAVGIVELGGFGFGLLLEGGLLRFAHQRRVCVRCVQLAGLPQLFQAAFPIQAFIRLLWRIGTIRIHF